MVSKRFIVAAVAVAALVGQDDNDHSNEKLARVMACKVIIAAITTHALVGRLFTLLSSSYSGSEIETTGDDGDGWRFPPDRWIKCNVDGSAPEDKASGCGGVFRDSTGSWLYGFATSFDRCTSSAAELLAIDAALDVAWDRGYRRLILETDSLTVADVVNKKDGASARREKELVEKIRDKKKNRKWDVQIVHSNREGNKVADWLANLSHGLQVGDQIELQKLPHGCRSCHELMVKDTRFAKTKAERLGTDISAYIGVMGTAFLLVMYFCFGTGN